MPALRAVAFVLLATALPAQADLYRWIDPETGSVKLANSPPAWYETGSGPAVERIPFGAPPAGRAAAPQKPAAQPPVAALETRWRGMLRAIGALRQSEFTSPDDAVRQQILAFQALTGELDRLDPAGHERRTDEQMTVMQRMRQ